MSDILTFTTPETRWLSNMTYVSIEHKGITYPSTENFYQAMKYIEVETRKHIATLKPVEAKKYSRENPMTNPNFEDNKIRIMEYAQRKKYDQEPFRTMLLNTGDCLLEEGNWWGDNFWGVDIKTREGCNHLGKIIMCVRDRLRLENTVNATN